MVYAVIDTNIFVSALITHNSKASTVKVLESMFMNRFTPLYNEEIIEEYEDVLHRRKFKLTEEQIRTVIDYVKTNGIDSNRFPYDDDMPDEDDCLAAIPAEQKAEFDLSFGIAERISEMLKAKGLTQKDFARLLNKRDSEISKWLTGRHNFTTQTIARIETALGSKLISIAH